MTPKTRVIDARDQGKLWSDLPDCNNFSNVTFIFKDDVTVSSMVIKIWMVTVDTKLWIWLKVLQSMENQIKEKTI